MFLSHLVLKEHTVGYSINGLELSKLCQWHLNKNTMLIVIIIIIMAASG